MRYYYIIVYQEETDGDIIVRTIHRDDIREFLMNRTIEEVAVIDGWIVKDMGSKTFELDIN